MKNVLIITALFASMGTHAQQQPARIEPICLKQGAILNATEKIRHTCTRKVLDALIENPGDQNPHVTFATGIKEGMAADATLKVLSPVEYAELEQFLIDETVYAVTTAITNLQADTETTVEDKRAVLIMVREFFDIVWDARLQQKN